MEQFFMVVRASISSCRCRISTLVLCVLLVGNCGIILEPSGAAWSSFASGTTRCLQDSRPELVFNDSCLQDEFLLRKEGGVWEDDVANDTAHGTHAGVSNRIVFMNKMGGPNGKAGLDDRLSIYTGMLQLATYFDAKLVLPPPKFALGAGHGKSDQDRWDSYFHSKPPVYLSDDVHCDIPATIVEKPNFLPSLPDEVRESLFDKSKPLCLDVRFHYYEMKYSRVANSTAEYNLVRAGSKLVVVRPSLNVMHVLADVLAESPLLGGNYHALHVRRGDKASNCTNIQRVLKKMKEVPKAKGTPWFVMSNAHLSWRKQFEKEAKAAGFKVIMETALASSFAHTDNYTKYEVLECLFAHAKVGVDAFNKQVGHFCFPNRHVPQRILAICPTSVVQPNTTIS